MLTRRLLLAGSTATLAAPYVASHARAATPKNAVVMVRQIDDIVSFDPAESYEFTNNEVDGNCYRRLVRPDPANSTKVAGDLAESYNVSADGLTFTFKLKQDAKFDSGNPVTAHDAAFSLQRVVKLNKTPGFIITQFGFTADNVEKFVRAVDDYTLEMKLPTEAEATSFVLYCLSANVGSVVDMKTVLANQTNNDLGNGWLKTHTAGAGPYRLTSWQASDHVIIDANPHAAEKPNIPRVVLRHVADPAVQLLQLQKGDADIARDLGADQLKTIAGNKDLTISASPQGTSMYIAMNQSMPELQKVQVHQAIKWAIDYEAIAREHHAEHLERLPGLSALCAAGRPQGEPVPQGRREGEAAAGGGRAAQRLLGHHGLHLGGAVPAISRRRSRRIWRRSASRCSCCRASRSRSSPRPARASINWRC